MTISEKTILRQSRCATATTFFKTTVDEHRRRLIEGEKALRDLKTWSEDVLNRRQESSLDDERRRRETTMSPSEGVGAQLLAEWNTILEERFQEQLVKVSPDNSSGRDRFRRDENGKRNGKKTFKNEIV